MIALFPSGLVLYWMTNTVLSILQQWRINAAWQRGAAKTPRAAGRPRAVTARPRRHHRRDRHRRRAAAASASCGSPGPRCRAIARGIARRAARAAPRRRCARFRDADGEPIDEGLALYFPAPHSYTGEHVLELQGHGGPVVARGAGRRALVGSGARRARPGEFTRARLPQRQARPRPGRGRRRPDRCRLAAAAARAALRSLQGEFSARVAALSSALTRAAGATSRRRSTFPDEEIDFLGRRASCGAPAAPAPCAAFDALQRSARQGRLLREGLTRRDRRAARTPASPGC